MAGAASSRAATSATSWTSSRTRRRPAGSPTRVIDRKWFESVYVRTQGGVLFEFATEGPGYTIDEDLDELGERLVLPEWLEDRREEIEAGLPPLSAAPSPE